MLTCICTHLSPHVQLCTYPDYLTKVRKHIQAPLLYMGGLNISRTGWKRFPIAHSKESCELNIDSWQSDIWRAKDGGSQCSGGYCTVWVSVYHSKPTTVIWETCSDMKVDEERFANLEHPLQFLCCFLNLPDRPDAYFALFSVTTRMKLKVSYHGALQVLLTSTFSIKANCR